MNLYSYLKDLERSVANLPDIMAQWDRVPEGLKCHYLEELDLFVVRFNEVLSVADKEGRLVETTNRILRALDTLRDLSVEYPILSSAITL
jgi:hypothetical protein